MILAKKKNSALWYPYIPLCSSWVKFLINLKIEKWLDYFLCSDVCLTQWYAVRRKSIGNSWQLYVRFAWLEKAVIWLFLFTIESNPDEVVTAKENVWKSARENKDALQRLKKKSIVMNRQHWLGIDKDPRAEYWGMCLEFYSLIYDNYILWVNLT